MIHRGSGRDESIIFLRENEFKLISKTGQVFQSSNAGEKAVEASPRYHKTRKPCHRFGTTRRGYQEFALLRCIVAHERVLHVVQTNKVALIDPGTHDELKLIFKICVNEQAQQTAFDAVVGIGGIIRWPIGHSSSHNATLMTITTSYHFAARVSTAHMSTLRAAVSVFVVRYIIIVIELIRCDRWVWCIAIRRKYQRN